ncbi:E3 ubiquitin-protein ligase WAV3 [Sesamum alatum]|uniref:E3 ubiquitin-protein ligase WAV3 n=1 Tax=Sesamum alatum TaxID=300844 RepID=A0AAE1YTA9_9LAMI|nr:E3 ubiquitin-protein ligase WAV3 [Sesamum alatum]
METGQGRAIFTAECSHSFHFSCIAKVVTHGSHRCPVCRVKWNHLRFTNGNHCPFDYSSSLSSQVPQPQLQVRPVFELEPLQFSDDEALPAVIADLISSASLSGLQKVNVEAVPECTAVAASESVSDFAVLVRLRAPSMSQDGRFKRAPVDLVTVLDVSGSMHGSKLALVKRAVCFIIDNLGPSDRLSVVSFATRARRVLPLCRMTDHGGQEAKRAVSSLVAKGSTNVVEGLKKGVQVLEERRHRNPIASIIFLSDGRDTCSRSSQFQLHENARHPPQYLQLLPASICPANLGNGDEGQQQTFPVHAFGFGSDHDPLAMHAVSDTSGGTFSFIESYEMVQDAFASCIGGLLSVVTQDLHLIVRAASHGVEIKSIPSGRYASEISNEGFQAVLNVGDLYADEEKEFLINLSVPVLQKNQNIEGDENERKTSLLDVTCSYKDTVSNETVQVECDLVEIRRPKSQSSQDMIVNLEVDRQKNRLNAARSIAEAQRMAEAGDLAGAQTLLANRRSTLLKTASGQAADGLCMWLEAEMKEMEKRMGNRQSYERAGRAYVLSSMSSHASQRATTRGNNVPGAATLANGNVGAYATPSMANMVNKSLQVRLT